MHRGVRKAYRFSRTNRMKKTLGRSRCKWEDNIKMNVIEIGCEGVKWFHLVQDRFQWRASVKIAVNHRVL
jgi:hypothetical protein